MGLSETVEALIPIIKALRWPVVILFTIALFRKPIASLISNIEGLVLESGKVEAKIRQEGYEAATSFEKALEEKLSDYEIRPSESIQESTFAALQGANILWVDDRPQNNRYERRALEMLGATVETSETTGDALKRIKSNDYDVILSDMGRPEDERAGYTLLERIRDRDGRTPFVIYSYSNKQEHKEEAERRSAVGSTNRPDELFQLIEEALLYE